MESFAPASRPRLNSEVALLKHLGIPDFRHLSKDAFFRFLETLPDTDPEVALSVLGQVPDLATFARSALVDATEAFDALLASNEASRTMVHAVHMKRLDVLRAELEKELTAEQWARVLDDLREVNANELGIHADGRRWLSESLRAKLAVSAAAAMGLAAVIFTASKVGDTAVGGFGRLLRS